MKKYFRILKETNKLVTFRELNTYVLMEDHVFEIVRDIINDRCQKGLRFNSKLIKFQFHFTVTNPYGKGVHNTYHVANVRRCVKNTFF